MRNMGNMKKTITATPRQLESMIRIAESLAKMRLSETVEKRDVEEAVRLIKTAMQQSATDPTTGEIDMDIIATGISSAASDKVAKIIDIIKGIKEQHGDKFRTKGIQYVNLYEYIQNQVAKKDGKAITEPELRDALRKLEDDNFISSFGNMRNPTIRFISE
jgi:DNA replication licensing factor MCM4